MRVCDSRLLTTPPGTLPVASHDRVAGSSITLTTGNVNLLSIGQSITDNNTTNPSIVPGTTIIGIVGNVITLSAAPLLDATTSTFVANSFNLTNSNPPSIQFIGTTSLATSSITLSSSNINQLVVGQQVNDINTQNLSVAPGSTISSIDYVNLIVYLTNASGPAILLDATSSTFVQGNFNLPKQTPPNIIFNGVTSAANSTITLTEPSVVNSIVVGQAITDNNSTNPSINFGTTVLSIDLTNAIIYLTNPTGVTVTIDGASSSFNMSNFPTPVGSYNVTIDPYGKLSIYANGTFAMTIPPGPHTLLAGTSILIADDQCIKKQIKAPKNFIIQKDFTDISQFVGDNLADGIRDTQVNDTFEDVVAYAWTSNANFVKLGQQSNGVTNLYLCVGNIDHKGKISLGPVQQITDYQPLPTVIFSATVVAGSNIMTNVTNITSLVIGQLVTDNNTSNPSVPTISDQYPFGTLIVSIDLVGDTVTLSNSALLSVTSTYTATQFPGYSSQIFDSSIAINRKNKNTIAVSWGYANAQLIINFFNGIDVTGQNFVLPYIAYSTNGGLPSSWTSYIIDSTLVFPNGAGDCRGVIADRYGNFLYNLNNVDYGAEFEIGIALTSVQLYICSDITSQVWTNIFTSTESQVTGGVKSFDYPQFILGNSGDSNNPYGVYFGSDFGSFISLNVNTIPYIGFIPITGLGIYSALTYWGPINDGISNNVEHAVLTTKNDGTLFLMYQKNLDNEFASNGLGSSVSPHILFVKPPGPINPNTILGPYTSFQHVNDYEKPVNSWPQPGFAYFPITYSRNVV